MPAKTISFGHRYDKDVFDGEGKPLFDADGNPAKLKVNGLFLEWTIAKNKAGIKVVASKKSNLGSAFA